MGYKAAKQKRWELFGIPAVGATLHCFVWPEQSNSISAALGNSRAIEKRLCHKKLETLSYLCKRSFRRQASRILVIAYSLAGEQLSSKNNFKVFGNCICLANYSQMLFNTGSLSNQRFQRPNLNCRLQYCIVDPDRRASGSGLPAQIAVCTLNFATMCTLPKPGMIENICSLWACQMERLLPEGTLGSSPSLIIPLGRPCRSFQKQIYRRPTGISTNVTSTWLIYCFSVTLSEL